MQLITQQQETIRGIPCENFWIVDTDYYLPGYGRTTVRHDFYFMDQTYVREFLQRDAWIPVQRMTAVQAFRNDTGNQTVLGLRRFMYLNFFDYTVPTLPALYDFTIPECFTDSSTGNSGVYVPESSASTTIQLRFPITPNNFPINFTSNTLERRVEFLPEMRREVVKAIARVRFSESSDFLTP